MLYVLYFLAGLAGLFVLAVIGVLIEVFIHNARNAALQKKMFAEYESQWQFYQRGVDLMRRRAPNGEWQYRAMTAEEYREYITDHW